MKRDTYRNPEKGFVLEKTKPIFVFVVCVISLWSLQSVAVAGTINVTCGPKETIGNALNKLKPGDTLVVSGTCNENVVIYAEFNRITLDGQGKATINGPDANTAVISVVGRDVTIKGFTVRGGRGGISIISGGMAVVDGNTVENTGSRGVQVGQNSTAWIINNTIRNNPNNGIQIAGSSLAWIGFIGGGREITAPNTIQGNGAAGINVNRASSARIHGNTIADNNRAGVAVQGASQADIGGNAINSNRGEGILVEGNSIVNLGSDTGSGLDELPNTSGAPNSGFGIRCSINSSADGRLGTLNGSKGAKDFSDTGCVDSLIP